MSTAMLFPTAIAGSLPKPGWLAEIDKLWPRWRAEGAALDAAKADATLLAIKLQEDAGLSVVGDGEQARQHVVHGFVERVEGIDFAHKEVADTIGRALQFVARERLVACTICGMAPMRREIATAKLGALAQGAALARERFA